MAIEAEIRKQITKYGHIKISRLMSLCLSELDSSYYRSKIAILDTSAQNDFLTSPSISQMFGEIISLWCIETWQRLGSPEDFNLIEFGAGEGSLLFDILRTTQKICPAFYSAVNVKIIDINEKLIQKQRLKLESHLFFPQSINPTNSAQSNSNSAQSTEIEKTANKITWYKSFLELKNQMLSQSHNQSSNNNSQNNHSQTHKTKSILIANEFFDALPINQYIKIGNSWHEIVLTVDEITKHLKFTSIRLTEKYSSILNSEHPNSIDGSVYEESSESIELIKEIADFFTSDPSSSNISSHNPSHSDISSHDSSWPDPSSSNISWPDRSSSNISWSDSSSSNVSSHNPSHSDISSHDPSWPDSYHSDISSSSENQSQSQIQLSTQSSTNPPSSSQQPHAQPQSQSNFSFLIIDYGYEISNYKRIPIQYKNTLQAIKSHKYVYTLSTLGEADLSAHVNFHKLKEIAKSRFLNTEGAISQKDFLISYGINSRKEILLNKNSQNQQLINLINAQYDRLVNKMGSLFNCLIINDFHQ